MNSDDRNSEKLAESALDRLLEQAPSIENFSALKARIMDVAANTNTSAAAGGITLANAPGEHIPAGRIDWWVPALLAASLLVGIWAGATGLADMLVSAPLSMAGLEIPGDSEFYKSGLSVAEELL